MIVHRTFSVTHMVNAGPRGLAKRERLREDAERFISDCVKEEDVVSITESADEYASSVTVWYRKT